MQSCTSSGLVQSRLLSGPCTLSYLAVSRPALSSFVRYSQASSGTPKLRPALPSFVGQPKASSSGVSSSRPSSIPSEVFSSVRLFSPSLVLISPSLLLRSPFTILSSPCTILSSPSTALSSPSAILSSSSAILTSPSTTLQPPPKHLDWALAFSRLLPGRPPVETVGGGDFCSIPYFT